LFDYELKASKIKAFSQFISPKNPKKMLLFVAFSEHAFWALHF
jgi:hypothetical protein